MSASSKIIRRLISTKSTGGNSLWFKKPITKISYFDFLSHSPRTSLNSQLYDFSVKVSNGSKLQSTEELFKPYLSLPAVSLGHHSEDSKSSGYEESIPDIIMRKMKGYEERQIPDEFFDTALEKFAQNGGYENLSHTKKKKLRQLFWYQTVNNSQERLFKNEDGKEEISAACIRDIVDPVISLLQTIGVNTHCLIKQKIATPSGSNNGPKYVMTSDENSIPFEIQPPFKEEPVLTNNLMKKILSYMISMKSDTAMISTYFRNYVIHLSETDVNTLRIHKDGEFSLRIGVREFANNDENITPVLALCALIMRNTKNMKLGNTEEHMGDGFKHLEKLIPQLRMSEEESERASQKLFKIVIKDAPQDEITDMKLSLKEFEEIETLKVGPNSKEQFISVKKSVFFKYYKATRNEIEAFENESHVLVRIWDPITGHHTNIYKDILKKFYEMRMVHLGQILDYRKISKQYNIESVKYIHEQIGYGIIKITSDGIIKFFGSFTFHKPANIITKIHDVEESGKVLRCLKELHESNFYWPDYLPIDSQGEKDGFPQDYLVQDPITKDIKFLDLRLSSSPLSSSHKEDEEERLIKLIDC